MKMMKLVVFGVTHKTAPISLREKVAFTKSKVAHAYELMEQEPFIKESIIISTCNRSEVFAIVEDIKKGQLWFTRFFEAFFQLAPDTLQGCTLYKTGPEAAQYLFEICCGMDSLVLGEDQILGQVKDAYYEGMEAGASGKILNRLFLEAISTAKEIKATTGISNNSLSISSIAVKQIERKLGDLSGKKVLVIGLGTMGRIAIENLLEKGVGTVFVSNRSQGAFEALKKKHPSLQTIAFEERYQLLDQVEIVISATGSPHCVLKEQPFREHYHGKQPLCIVDIALPRDVESGIGQVAGVSLFHIDELKEIAAENMAYRESCLQVIREAIQVGVQEYCDWYRCLPIYARIEALKQYSDQLTEEELERLFRQLSHLSEGDKAHIALVVKSLVKKIWRKPILQMKQAGISGRGENMGALIDELFDFHLIKHRSEGGSP